MSQTDTDLDHHLKYVTLCADDDESHRKVLAFIPAGSRVLEVGAATGYMSLEIQRRGCTVVAVEPDDQAAVVARARGIDVRVGRLESIDFQGDAPFDCLVFADVLEHVSEPHAFLDAGLRMLKPGGTVVVSVPNVAHWSVRWHLVTGRFDYTKTGLLDDTHARFYTAASLARLLEAHGLMILERATSLGLWELSRWRAADMHWYRRRILRALAHWFPGLFAFQFVWKARFAGAPAGSVSQTPVANVDLEESLARGRAATVRR